MTRPALPNALWTVAASCPQTQHPPSNTTTILEQRKARRTATYQPESRSSMGWMCQLYHSVVEKEQACIPRAIAKRDLVVLSSKGYSYIIFTYSSSHNSRYVWQPFFCLWYLPLYLILDTRLILLCANIMDQFVYITTNSNIYLSACGLFVGRSQLRHTNII